MGKAGDVDVTAIQQHCETVGVQKIQHFNDSC
jgi:hypothetical protein